MKALKTTGERSREAPSFHVIDPNLYPIGFNLASKLFFCGFISFIVEIPPKLPLSPKKIEQSIEDG